MTELNQLYCTHCTYGTSALHRRDGAQGEQVFEYSTRSGSVRREESHDIFRRFEPFMHFRVPGDFPASELVKNTADTLTIRRLIYHPAVSGLRMLAHVSFCTTDTRGRPGSYFAHVLLENHSPGMTPWSAAECLKLWGSKNWKLKDQPDHPFELVPHSSFSGFDGNLTPPINDQTLLSFLTTSAGCVFNDPGSVIPERWRRKSPENRQAVLVNALQGVLEIDIERRESVLLAVEPSVAALIFYGIARLLPQKGIGEKLSFSTYESHFDRPATILAATCFHNPETADLSPESYSSTARGVTINTFNGRSTPRRRDGAYG